MTFKPMVILLLLMPALSFSQGRGPETSSTAEEEFYEGDQVNPEAFEGDEVPLDEIQEEEAPYDPFTEIWPYEQSEQESEEDESDPYAF